MTTGRKREKWIALSLKKKFYCLIGGITGLAFLTIMILYLYMNLLMGKTQQVLKNNDVSLDFQVSMEAERRGVQNWAAGQNGSAEKELELVCRDTQKAVDALPASPEQVGLEQYQVTWSILNSFQVYQQKRDALLATGRHSEKFAEELYTVYDMQNYLMQYGTRLTQMVMREGNEQYRKTQSDFDFMPVVLILVGFVVLVSLAATSRKMDGLFIEPVVKLSQDAGRMALNDFGGTLPVREEQDEMGELIAAFARMKSSTSKYIETLKENNDLQLQLEKVQLQMLKNQINPHFLFNTLNMISCMAQMEEATVTDRMIRSMSHLFQYALKSSETVTPLSNEVKVVEDYMYLQKMRFEDRLTYQIQVGEGTENRMVPSFILQPLVENAVIHGIADKEDGGSICVKSWMEGAKLWISVSDTGVGMEPEMLDRLRAERIKVKSGHGIGLGNICKRIQIMYQDGVVQIDSTVGKGTVIQIGFTENTGEDEKDETDSDTGRG